MNRMKIYKWSLVVMLLFFAGATFFALILPDDAQVPVHWNFRNEIDSWAGKWSALGMYAGIGLFVFLLFYLMPYYSPRYRKYEARNERVMPALCLILLLFMAVQGLYAMYLAYYGITQPDFQLMMVLIGMLFIFMGNLLPKVPKNFFVGIKTPWTLTSAEVWHRTHRLGGLLFVISGLIMIGKAFIPAVYTALHLWTTLLAFALILYPLLHSFLIYKKLPPSVS